MEKLLITKICLYFTNYFIKLWFKIHYPFSKKSTVSISAVYIHTNTNWKHQHKHQKKKQMSKKLLICSILTYVTTKEWNFKSLLRLQHGGKIKTHLLALFSISMNPHCSFKIILSVCPVSSLEVNTRFYSLLQFAKRNMFWEYYFSTFYFLL